MREHLGLPIQAAGADSAYGTSLKWSKLARERRAMCERGEITFERYLEWLDITRDSEWGAEKAERLCQC